MYNFFADFAGIEKIFIDLFLSLEKSNNNLVLYINDCFTMFYK